MDPYSPVDRARWGRVSARFGTPSDLPSSSDALVTRINAMSDADAADAFRRCCGAERWVNAMVNARPSSRTELFGEAERIWWHLGDGWLAALIITLASVRMWYRFERSLAPQPNCRRRNSRGPWAHRGGSQALASHRGVLETYGFIFIVCATGRQRHRCWRS